MSRARISEDLIVARIDRSRGKERNREARTARTRALEDRAALVVANDVDALPEHERAAYAEILAAAVRARLVMLHGAPSATAILSREAHEAGKGLMPRLNVRAEAEKLFKPANDRGEG